MNNVDIAIQQLRELQQHLFDHSKSHNDLFAFTTQIINKMEKASKEINTNYEEISRKLTEELNTGRKQ